MTEHYTTALATLKLLLAEEKTRGLRSRRLIFDFIQLNGESQKEKYWLPLQKLSLAETAMFPLETQSNEGAKKLLDPLLKELETHHNNDVQQHAQLENLMGKLQLAAWNIGAPDHPEVSFYDYCRIETALAVCGEKALLVGGDISGIQSFIYTISSKGAAKTLRGRSFYLQLLTEAILRFALKQLGELPYTQVIYSGGGHFFLLAPAAAAEKLPLLQIEITRKLLGMHGIKLYMALGWAEATTNELRTNAAAAWGEMHNSLGERKRRKYAELDAGEMYDNVFAIPEYGGDRAKICDICGEERHSLILKEKLVKLKFIKQEEGNLGETKKVCTLCASFVEEIGGDLPNATHVALEIMKQPNPSASVGTAKGALETFGLGFEVLKEKDVPHPKNIERITYWALDDIPVPPPPHASLPSAHLLRFTVNQMPRDEEGQILDFDTMQENMSGFKRLAALRMDVDNLGSIFKDGLNKNGPGLAQLATLSGQMSLYFEGWVKTLCAGHKEKVYAVYTGGDDLFLIGEWQVMPELALKIYSDFEKYTGKHPALHISGGLSFMHGKYPVYRAAEDAGSEEDKAKDVNGKDAFTFLEEAHKWGDFKNIAKNKALLVGIIDGGGPQSLIQDLRKLHLQMAETQKKDKVRLWGSWNWMAAYHLFRAQKSAEGRVAKDIEAIRNELTSEGVKAENFRNWGYVARWAQLENRKNQEHRK